VASPISVIESDDVFEARIAWPGVTASRSENTACLISITLGNGLDDEVDVAEAVVFGRAVDAADHRVDLLARRLLGELAALDELLDLALGDLARLGQPGLDEVVVDVLEHHRIPADAMVWAIWPPMVPAPTTAALKTNMFGTALLRTGKERQARGVPGHPLIGPGRGRPGPRGAKRRSVRSSASRCGRRTKTRSNAPNLPRGCLSS